MIVKMTKATILIMKSKTNAATKQLKKLGLLHPEISESSSEEIDRVKEKISDTQSALSSLPEAQSDRVFSNLQEDEVYSLISRVRNTDISIKNLYEERERLARQESQWAVWGVFNPRIIEELKQAGVSVNLCSLSKEDDKNLRNTIEGVRLFTIRNLKAGKLVAIVGELPDEYKHLAMELPNRSLTEIRKKIIEIDQEIVTLKDHLSSMTMESTQLNAYLQKLLDRLEFSQVEASMLEHGEVSIISGYLPKESLPLLNDAAKHNGWGLVTKAPSEGDRVPTLTKNPKAVKIIQPVFDLLGTIPGYREHDISLWFLMFFTVFFAMIIGDAGYGILLFILSSFITIRQKRRGAVSDGLILLNLLSFATIVWGGITGNWFGFEPISKLPGFRDIIIPSLNTYTDGSADAVKFLCFVIGTVHIVLAHTIQFVKKIREKPYIHAFGQIGWMTTILGLYYLVLSVVISSAEYPIPNFALPMIGIGMGFVFIFDNQEGDGFFRGVIRSLANIIPTALSGVSSFSDIISYIRLYAVGLSGFAIAQSFNSMAKGIMETGAIGIAAGIVVVLLGHTLNLAMAGLSVVVHGVRLNMLEFSNHVGNEWAGFAYKPFGEQTQ